MIILAFPDVSIFSINVYWRSTSFISTSVNSNNTTRACANLSTQTAIMFNLKGCNLEIIIRFGEFEITKEWLCTFVYSIQTIRNQRLTHIRYKYSEIESIFLPENILKTIYYALCDYNILLKIRYLHLITIHLV